MNRTYSETFSVRVTECDRFGRFRPDALFLSMQHIADLHATELDFGYHTLKPLGLFFALIRVHLTIYTPAVCGQKVTHTTWPGVNNRFFCPRYHVFTAEDGTVLAAASALWVILDTKTRAIVSPQKSGLHFPDTSDMPAPVSLPGKPASAHADSMKFLRAPVYSEYDANGHLNNTRYIAWLCDALGNKTLENAFIKDLTVGYEKEILSEDPLELRLAADGDDFSFSVFSQDGIKRFVASGTLSREV